MQHEIDMSENSSTSICWVMEGGMDIYFKVESQPVEKKTTKGKKKDEILFIFLLWKSTANHKLFYKKKKGFC